MYNFNGKIALVTGAGRGIGRATAKKLAQNGAKIAAVDRTRSDLETLKEEIEKDGGECFTWICDISDVQQINVMVEKVHAWGRERIDFLVNSAGVGICNFLDNVDEEDWDRTLDINLKGTFFVCKTVAPIMRAQQFGKIVNIASIAGVTGGPTLFPYNASKAGLINITHSLAIALGPFGINVNAVNPGLVWTPMWKVTDKWIQDNIPPFKDEPYVTKKAYDASIQASVALKRPTNPEHIANVVAFLVSEEASEVTGQHINVDGGIEYH